MTNSEREKKHRYRQKYPEKIRAKKAAYRARHREELREKDREYQSQEEIKNRRKEWEKSPAGIASKERSAKKAVEKYAATKEANRLRKEAYLLSPEYAEKKAAQEERRKTRGREYSRKKNALLRANRLKSDATAQELLAIGNRLLGVVQ